MDFSYVMLAIRWAALKFQKPDPSSIYVFLSSRENVPLQFTDPCKASAYCNSWKTNKCILTSRIFYDLPFQLNYKYITFALSIKILCTQVRETTESALKWIDTVYCLKYYNNNWFAYNQICMHKSSTLSGYYYYLCLQKMAKKVQPISLLAPRSRKFFPQSKEKNILPNFLSSQSLSLSSSTAAGWQRCWPIAK